MKVYDHKTIDKKWQDKWEEAQLFKVSNDFSKPKFYPLVEFPYPSGSGLHIGHPRPYTAMDIVARKRRMQGYNVLFTLGWDAFGLPTENYAIKNKIHPAKVTERNIENFKRQCRAVGFSFDWSREIDTTSPEYYRWTQWIFLQFFKQGLAYKKEMNINWCNSCKAGLANEEVIQGHCERCDSPVTQRLKSQWILGITKYADRLSEDLDSVDFIERVKLQQRNWIGKSQGASIKFPLSTGDLLEVYTTRPDTIYGATYMVISPEHPLLDKHQDIITNYQTLLSYRHEASLKSELERAELSKEKTGVRVEGIKAINPVSGKEIEVWVSDYVLMTYGTGAIMAVPAHDERDYEFAQKFSIDILPVVRPDIDGDFSLPFVEEGYAFNSPIIDGLTTKAAKAKMIEYITEKGYGEAKTNFKLRDWLFSRQRYWGEPIPLVHCKEHGWVPLPEDSLPLLLPEVESYEPTDNGESPLAAITDWVHTTCPICGKDAIRETDTMPQWAGSSWYYLRYTDPTCSTAIASKEAMDYWMPVDWYNGGMEHTTLHLLYSRFWHKFLYDQGVVKDSEPYLKRTSHGMILADDGTKMSKSKGNSVSPDYYCDLYGADSLRLYEMFIGDFEKSIPWNTDGVRGARRFIDKVWDMSEEVIDGDAISPALEKLIHKTIKKVTHDYETLKFNTAIAALMTLFNEMKKVQVNRAEFEVLLKLLNPVCPHFTEEIWEKMGHSDFLSVSEWPSYDEEKTKDDEVEMAVQINGKLRATILISVDADEEMAKKLALSDEKVKQHLEGLEIKKIIYVKGKIFNIVAK